MLALAAWIDGAPQALLALWFVSLPVIFCSSRVTRGATDERLDLRLAYHVAAAAALAIPLVGALFAAVPGHSAVTTIFAGYFGLVALVGYRAVVARGPRRALAVVTITHLMAVPFLFVAAIASMGCKCGRWREPPWTDRATLLACLLAMLFAMILAAVALIAFHPRDEGMPEARLAR